MARSAAALSIASRPSARRTPRAGHRFRAYASAPPMADLGSPRGRCSVNQVVNAVRTGPACSRRYAARTDPVSRLDRRRRSAGHGPRLRIRASCTRSGSDGHLSPPVSVEGPVSYRVLPASAHEGGSRAPARNRARVHGRQEACLRPGRGPIGQTSRSAEHRTGPRRRIFGPFPVGGSPQPVGRLRPAPPAGRSAYRRAKLAAAGLVGPDPPPLLATAGRRRGGGRRRWGGWRCGTPRPPSGWCLRLVRNPLRRERQIGKLRYYRALTSRDTIGPC